MAPHGYETDLFVDEAQLEAAICQICNDVPREALLHPRCGKSVCRECALYASEDDKPCGYCNEAFVLDAISPFASLSRRHDLAPLRDMSASNYRHFTAKLPRFED